MWEKVLHTSLVVWIINVFVFLISYGEYTVVTLVSYLLSIFVLLCGGAVLFTAARNHFRKQNNPWPWRKSHPRTRRTYWQRHTASNCLDRRLYTRR